jgi:hypothetical protein
MRGLGTGVARLTHALGVSRPAARVAKILEIFFLMEEKTAIRVQNFRDDTSFQDLFV